MRSVTLWGGILALVLSVGTGCGNEGEGEKLGRNLDDAMEHMEDKADDVGDRMEDAADDFGDEMDQLGEDVEDEAEDLGEQLD